MKNKLIVANLKMNFFAQDLKEYIENIGFINSDNIVICPTNMYIPYFLNKNYSVGIQDICFKNEGLYTGEVSALQAKSIGVNYAIVGHSERRINFNESNSIINEKIKSCLESNMKVILCVGETIEEKENCITIETIKEQILESLHNIDDLTNIYIAYEPIWAIGTNKIPELEEIKQNILKIKQIIIEHFDFNNIRVLYGGSVNSYNISDLNIDIIDGFLIGNSSLNPTELKKIIDIVNRQN